MDSLLYKSDLEALLTNQAYKAFVSDLKERKEYHEGVLATTLLTTPKKIAEANKRIGQIEEIDFMLAFPALALAEIIDREQKDVESKEGKDNDGQ